MEVRFQDDPGALFSHDNSDSVYHSVLGTIESSKLDDCYRMVCSNVAFSFQDLFLVL